MSVITISRQLCSLGDEIAAGLARKLAGRLVTRANIFEQVLKDVATPADLRMLAESPKYYLRQTAAGATFKQVLEEWLKKITGETNVVIVGMGSQIIFANDPAALHLRTVASLKTRLKRVQSEYRVSAEQAQGILSKADKKHKRYVSALYGLDNSDPALYDLVLNTDRLCSPECIQAVLALLEERERTPVIPQSSGENPPVIQNPERPPVFKNTAESEFAGILDMYSMDWEYEPRTFPIEWDAEGNVTSAFSPDFYLPKFDTYIEITTMNQKYVTTKNKKVKKLRELYPGVHVSIIYKNDFQTLLERFKMNKGDE